MADANKVTQTSMMRHHFTALDSWRGICACLVVLLHVNAYSHAFFSPFIQNAGLFVDFFFVLSGFVIAANYQSRLREGYSVGKFMFLRLGRLYPIHLVMLFAYIAFEFLFADMISSVNAGGRAAFSGATSVEAIWVNLFMLQGLGVLDEVTWNYPSWSVSAELAAYFLFALAVVYLRGSFFVMLALLTLLGPLWIYAMADGMLANRFMGLARCLAGFSAGVICLYIYHLLAPSCQKWSRLWMTLIECLCILLVVSYVSFATGPTTYALGLPFFFLTVLVFANQGGWISRLLLLRPFVFVGALSFSIYMVHALVTARLANVFQLAAAQFDLDLLTYVIHDGRAITMLGKTLWQGSAYYVLALLVVIFVSYLTYRLIEVPSRDAFCKWAELLWPSGTKVPRVKKKPTNLYQGHSGL